MLIRAFLITLRRLVMPSIAAMVGCNVVLMFLGSWLWWMVPIQIGLFLLLVIISSPIAYFKLTSYKKPS